MLNLGDEAAWQYCYDLLIGLFDKIGVDCYRQDFNWEPLEDWRRNDTPDRRGITEIKHIMGLYRLWDALLERYPDLLIDNCASGGRRMDIEMLRRSICLWRSDYQVYDNFRAEGAQSQNIGFQTWLPYSGTCPGRNCDTYRFRSAYSASLVVHTPFEDMSDDLVWLKGMLEEYLKVRPYMTEDFYPLTEVTECQDTWCAVQFNRPEENDGVVQVFRREKAPYSVADFALFGLDSAANYVFTDADTGEELVISGQTLLTEGITINLPKKYSCKLYFYNKK